MSLSLENSGESIGQAVRARDKTGKVFHVKGGGGFLMGAVNHPPQTQSLVCV